MLRGVDKVSFFKMPVADPEMLFLGESLSPTAWIGLGCVVAGVAAMTIPARKAAAVPKAA
jgi:threonine/homoserine efflux transporter RhtA